MWLWLDGRLLTAEEALLPADDRGLLLGEGLFETLLVHRGHPIEAAAHLARLAQSAASLGLELPWGAAELMDALHRLLAANRSYLDLQRSDAALRITLTGGSGPRGLLPPATARPRLLIGMTPYAAPDPGHAATAILSPWRVCAGSPLRGHKTLSAFEAVLAARHARRQGAQEAVLLNEAGHLVEAAAANLFLVSATGILHTPPLADGALPGVTRARVLDLAAAEGVASRADTSVQPSDLATASEAFVSNSLIGIRPLGAVLTGAASLITWPSAPGPVTRCLQTALRRAWAAAAEDADD